MPFNNSEWIGKLKNEIVETIGKVGKDNSV